MKCEIKVDGKVRTMEWLAREWKVEKEKAELLVADQSLEEAVVEINKYQRRIEKFEAELIKKDEIVVTQQDEIKRLKQALVASGGEVNNDMAKLIERIKESSFETWKVVSWVGISAAIAAVGSYLLGRPEFISWYGVINIVLYFLKELKKDSKKT